MPYANKYRKRRSRRPTYKKKTYKRKYAPRFAGSRPPARQSFKRRVVRTLNNIAETKLISAKNVLLLPSPFAGTLNNYKVHWNLGSTTMPSQIAGLPTGNVLNQFSLGTTNIDGQYVYMKQNTQTFQIRMLPLDNTDFAAVGLSPIQFRVLIVAPRSRVRTNFNPPPENLLINHAGVAFGYDTPSTVDNLSVRASLVNKRAWVVLKDTQFTLSPPAALAGSAAPPVVAGDIGLSAGGVNMRNPSFRMIRHTTMVNKKCFYGTAAAAHPPSNYMDDTYVCIMATTITGIRASNWTVDMMSTTTYTDM